MHRHILLHSGSEEKEFFSLKTSMILPLHTCISKVNRDQQGGILKGFQGEENKSFLFDIEETWNCSKRGGPWSKQ